ncbi:PilZ domain-containing protein [bacterium CPR1]|nr:PilZ domain-containing protein [bacterium CPR1]
MQILGGSKTGWVKLVILGGAIVVGLPLLVGGVYFLLGQKDQESEPQRGAPPEPGPEPPPARETREARETESEPEPEPEAPLEESFEQVEESVEASYELPPSLEMLPSSGETPRVVPAEIQQFHSVMVQALRLLQDKEPPGWLSSMVTGLKSFGVDSEKTPDRRRSIRVHSQLAIDFSLGEKSGQAQVVNIGLGGLHLYLDTEPERGDVVMLLDPASGRARPIGIKCVVQWVRKMPRSTRLLVGVNYDEKPEVLARSRLAQMLSELGFLENLLYRRRRKRRVKARLHVEVSAKAQEYEGTVLNIGVGGVLLECKQELLSTAPVTLTIGPAGRLYALTVVGEIRHRHQGEDGWQYGLRFLHLNPDQVKLLGKYVLEQLKEESG